MSCGHTSGKRRPPQPPLRKGGSKRAATPAQSLPPLRRGGRGGSAGWLSHGGNHRYTGLMVLLLGAMLPARIAPAAEPVDYTRQVKPILRDVATPATGR